MDQRGFDPPPAVCLRCLTNWATAAPPRHGQSLEGCGCWLLLYQLICTFLPSFHEKSFLVRGQWWLLSAQLDEYGVGLAPTMFYLSVLDGNADRRGHALFGSSKRGVLLSFLRLCPLQISGLVPPLCCGDAMALSFGRRARKLQLDCHRRFQC